MTIKWMLHRITHRKRTYILLGLMLIGFSITGGVTKYYSTDHELMVLNMVRRGLFGEVVHCQGGYRHDLREEVSTGREMRHYRFRNYLYRNCENYPTHELGPIANVLDINRGNRMLTLVSVASKAAGLHE